VTRVHDDVDSAVWVADWPRLETLLAGIRFAPKEQPFTVETQRLAGAPSDLEFWMLTTDVQGRVLVGGRWADWPFPDDVFAAPMGRLAEIECPVLSPHALLGSKADYPKHRFGAPLRPKDAQDIDALRGHLGLTC
jgi:hypothetical protein